MNQNFCAYELYEDPISDRFYDYIFYAHIIMPSQREPAYIYYDGEYMDDFEARTKELTTAELWAVIEDFIL